MVAVAFFTRARRPDLAYPDGEARTISVLLHR
jgi:hypothetical protein